MTSVFDNPKEGKDFISMDKKNFEDDIYYYPYHIANKLNISIRTVYRMVNDVTNPLPAVRIRHSLRIRGKDINEYLERNKTDPLWE